MTDYMREKFAAFRVGLDHLASIGDVEMCAEHDCLYVHTNGANEDDATMASLGHGWHWSDAGCWGFFT